MIVLLTAPWHSYTLRKLKPTEHRFPLPRIRFMNYERLYRSFVVPRATYIFADIERLSPLELRTAADHYRMLTEKGVRCLNDPARVLSRFELLRTLHAQGVNPFRAYRADDAPRPHRYPVFLRYEGDHGTPVSELIDSQDALDAQLDRLKSVGLPLRGMLVVEHCGAPYSDGLWHKWGTFRVGERWSVDHIAVDRTWLVKHGLWECLTERAVADEHEAVRTNRVAGELARAFDIAGIEFGRADHATVDGRTVVYEINTNPYVGPFVPDPTPLRLETQLIARRRLAEALRDIDTRARGWLTLPGSRHWKRHRAFVPGLLPPKRP
jgi:hypothetical protein